MCATGEDDVFNVTFNAYTAFLRDCHVPSTQCSSGELTLLFKLVDEQSAAPTKQAQGTALEGGYDAHNKQGTLARKE